MPESTRKSVWLGPAAKRHGPHVVVAAGAVVAAYIWMSDPDLIFIAALATFSSGVAAGAIECTRWAWSQITSS